MPASLALQLSVPYPELCGHYSLEPKATLRRGLALAPNPCSQKVRRRRQDASQIMDQGGGNRQMVALDPLGNVWSQEDAVCLGLFCA